MDLAAVRSVPAARSMQACAWCVGCVDGALPLPLVRCTGRSYMRLVGRCVCGCLVVEPGAQGSSPVARLQLRRGVGVVSGAVGGLLSCAGRWQQCTWGVRGWCN